MKYASNLLRHGSIAREVKSCARALFTNYNSLIQLQAKCYDIAETEYFLSWWKTLVKKQTKRENAFFQHATGNICINTMFQYSQLYFKSVFPSACQV